MKFIPTLALTKDYAFGAVVHLVTAVLRELARTCGYEFSARDVSFTARNFVTNETLFDCTFYDLVRAKLIINPNYGVALFLPTSNRFGSVLMDLNDARHQPALSVTVRCAQYPLPFVNMNLHFWLLKRPALRSVPNSVACVFACEAYPFAYTYPLLLLVDGVESNLQQMLPNLMDFVAVEAVAQNLKRNHNITLKPSANEGWRLRVDISDNKSVFVYPLLGARRVRVEDNVTGSAHEVRTIDEACRIVAIYYALASPALK